MMADVLCVGCQRAVWDCECDKPAPEPRMFETHPGHWNDAMNDVFVGRCWDGKMWRVTRRGPGNITELISKHRKLERALAAAEAIAWSPTPAIGG